MRLFKYKWLWLASVLLTNMVAQGQVATPTKPAKKSAAQASTLDVKEMHELDRKLLEATMSNDLFDYMHDEILSKTDTLPFTPSIPTALLKERLQALDATTPFRIEYNEDLERVIANYLKRNTTYMEKVMTLSDYYFPMIEAQLDKYDIPLEMKYLAIVESALNPKAKSRAGATGMWQFMYGTGKNFGLEVNSYIDERMDPIKATEAACKYLKVLHSIYNDWDLALAAYNSGPGNVNRAIKRSGGATNYWKLRSYLPRETANYVPAFQATMYIYHYAKEHGYQPGAVDFKRVETDTLLVKNKLSLERVATFLEEDIETLRFLNPSYKLDVIPVIPGKVNWIRLPRQAANNFVLKEDEVYAFANPDAPKPTENTELAQTSTPAAPAKEAQNRTVYTVRKGDYLSKIATTYRVGVNELKAWNKLNYNNLKVGQKLYIYTDATTPRAATPAQLPKTYIVQTGDSYWKIAKKYGLTIAVLKKLNPQVGDLKPGLKLRLS